VCVAVVLATIVTGELLIYSPPGQKAAATLGVAIHSAVFGADSTSVSLEITHAPADAAVRVVAFPLGNRTCRRPAVFVFDDPDYAIANASSTAADTALFHLAGELGVQRYGGVVQGVTATTLRDVLVDTSSAYQRAVVIVTGVMPSVIFSRSHDLVTPWVNAGGLLVWGGGTIGYWSASARQNLADAANSSLRERGTVQLLGPGVVRYPLDSRRTANQMSDFGSALDINYRLADVGVIRDAILGRGGLLLGWYSSTFSSVSYLPRGTGGYLIFGGPIEDADSVSIDLAQMLLSGVMYGVGPVTARTFQLSNSPSITNVKWDLPFSAAAAGIAIAAFDPDPDGFYYFHRVIVK